MTMHIAVPDAAHIRSVFERYAEHMCAGDADAIIALYASDASVEDPVGSSVLHGHEAIHNWYRTAFEQMGGRILMRLEGAVRIAGREAAAAFIATCDKHAQPFEVQTLDHMCFDDQGRITSMRAFWGDTNVRRL